MTSDKPQMKKNIYARKFISAGTVIIDEPCILFCGGSLESQKKAFDNLSEKEKSVIFSLPHEPKEDPFERFLSVTKSNTRIVGSVALFNSTSYFGNSCIGNCHASVTRARRSRIVTLRDIQPGEELTFAHVSSWNIKSQAVRKHLYKEHMNLECSCILCTHDTNVDEKRELISEKLLSPLKYSRSPEAIIKECTDVIQLTNLAFNLPAKSRALNPLFLITLPYLANIIWTGPDVEVLRAKSRQIQKLLSDQAAVLEGQESVPFTGFFLN